MEGDNPTVPRPSLTRAQLGQGTAEGADHGGQVRQPPGRPGDDRAGGGCCIRDEDEAWRVMAGEIQRRRPGWLVVWGCYSKHFVAFPLFPVRRRAILLASYPPALIDRIDTAERALRIRADSEE